MENKWSYFFGAGSERFFDSKILGFHVEKKVDKSGTRYAVGNFDNADIFFHSEEELVKHLKSRKGKLKAK